MTPTPLALAASQAVLASAPARVVYLRTPLATDVSEDDFEIVEPSSSIQSLAPEWKGAFVCNIDGAYIPRRDWWQPVRPGELVIFQAVPQGGQGGSNPLRIILMIAVMVVANVYGPALGGALGFSGTTAAAVGGAIINVVGTLAINALVPMSATAASNNAAAASPTYSIALQGNQARPEQVAPVGYGKMRTYPDFATQPYIEFVDNEQYYYALLKVGSTGGRGFYDVLGRYIDDTPTSEFQDVTVRVLGQTKDGYIDVNSDGLINTSMITASEVSGQELKDEGVPVGAFSVCKAGSKVSQIHFDITCPRGIGTAEDNGDISSRSVDFAFNIREIDDFDRAVGYWDQLGYEQIEANTLTPVQRSYTYNVPPGRYQVQAVRASEYSDNSKHMNDVTWAGMRATITTAGVNDPNATYLAIKIRASKQLSGASQRKVAVLWQRHLPVHNGIGWVVQATRNPGWALYDIWTNPEYGRGLPDSRLDLDALFGLAAVWDARQDRFDYMYDAKTTVHEAATQPARAGRATPLPRRGRYTLVRDELQELPIGLFTTRHMKKDSVTVEYTMPTEDQADTFRVKYRDGRYWEERYVSAQCVNGVIYVYGQNEPRPVGVPEPVKVFETTLNGILGLNHVKREAAYMLAVAQFRRRRVSWTLDKVGFLPAYGQLTGIVHDILQIGQDAEVFAYDVATRTITASQPMEWPAADVNCVVRLTTRTGGVTPTIPVVRGLRDNQIILAADLPSGMQIVESSDPKRLPTKLAFGTVTQGPCVHVLAQSLKPASGGFVAMSGPVEDIRVHLADAQWLPVDGVEQDPLSDGTASEGGLGESPFLEGLTFAIPSTVSLVSHKPAETAPGDVSKPESTIEFRADGSLHTLVRKWVWTYPEGEDSPYFAPTYVDQVHAGFASPQPISADAAGLLQVRCKLAEASHLVFYNQMRDPANPGLNQWHMLSSARVWHFVNVGGDTGCRLRFELRRRDTMQVVATYETEAILSEVGPGG